MPPTKTDPRYQWGHPREWLEHRLNDFENLEDLRQFAHGLAEQLDGDRIQDCFQADMEEDGYFRDLGLCPDCEAPLTEETTQDGYPSYCPACDQEIALP